MKFATHQPNFIPWPGLVYKAMKADRIVLLDQVQYPRGFSWINRNRLKGMHGAVWFTIPVLKKGLGLQIIDQVKVLPDDRWKRKHLMTLEHCYKRAPFFQIHFDFLQNLYSESPERLIQWNLATIDHIFQSFGLRQGYILQSGLGIRGRGTRLLVKIARELGADILVAPREAKAQIDIEILDRADIDIEWIDYHPPVYPQLWGEFLKGLSSFDLLFNYGPHAIEILKKANLPCRSG
jgi:hypothetical protein